jgi:methyl-accepting chemotaxis protein
MSEEKKDGSLTEEGLTLDKKTIEVLVAHIIPTSKYFEARFDHMQYQIDSINNNIKEFRTDVDRRFDGIRADMNDRFKQVDRRFEEVDRRFEDIKTDMNDRFGKVDRRFEQVDKRFEQVDKRFEQVDKRFEQMIMSIDRLSEKLDQRDERQRNFTLRMFTIAISISIIGVLGAFLKSLGVI